MERIFNNILDIHHQTERNIVMMLELELSRYYKDINIDYCYKRIYIETYIFYFKIVDDYIYIEYFDSKCLLDNTLYKQCQSIKSIIEFIEDSMNKIEKKRNE